MLDVQIQPTVAPYTLGCPPPAWGGVGGVFEARIKQMAALKYLNDRNIHFLDIISLVWPVSLPQAPFFRPTNVFPEFWNMSILEFDRIV